MTTARKAKPAQIKYTVIKVFTRVDYGFRKKKNKRTPVFLFAL